MKKTQNTLANLNNTIETLKLTVQQLESLYIQKDQIEKDIARLTASFKSLTKSRTPHASPSSRYRGERLHRRILAFLSRHPNRPFRCLVIAQAITGANALTVYATLWKMHGEGRIEKLSRGEYYVKD